MGPTKLPNPKSLRPLVVPVQEKEREILSALPCQMRKYVASLSRNRERETQHIA